MPVSQASPAECREGGFEWKHKPSVVTWYSHAKRDTLLSLADPSPPCQSVGTAATEGSVVAETEFAKEPERKSQFPKVTPAPPKKRGRKSMTGEKAADELTSPGPKRERKQTKFLGAEGQEPLRAESKTSGKRKKGDEEKENEIAHEDNGDDQAKKQKLDDPAAERGLSKEDCVREHGELQKHAEDPLTGQVVLVSVLQMRGSDSRFYVGCPVECKQEDRWEKATVAALPASASDKVTVIASATGKEMTVQPEKLRDDADALGKWEVGRHAQVLFDGELWYVGVVAATDGLNKKTQTGTVRLLFEDGEDCEVTVPDPDARLLPKEWSVQVGKLGKWGWWGYNSDRVARLKQHTGAAADAEAEGKQGGRKGGRGRPVRGERGGGNAGGGKARGSAEQRPKHVRAMEEFMDVEGAQAAAAGMDDEDEDEDDDTPVTPGRSGRERKQLDYSKMAAGVKKGEKKDHRKEISAAALAISLCDSLHEAAFSDWDSAARTKWKAHVAKASSAYPAFAAQLKAFEGKLALSAVTGGWRQARDTMMWELGRLKGEEQAKNCVSLLAGHVQGILYKSAQQRALCCGPFLRR